MDLKTLLRSSTGKRQKAKKPFPSADSIVLTSRIRLARNITGYPFPGWTKSEHRKEILNVIVPAVKSIPEFQKGYYAEMEELSPLEKQVLVEEHLISRELATRNDGCAVIINNRLNLSLMINEEDHIRIQVIQNGLSLQSAWNAANKLDDLLEERLDYAYSRNMGYLTACPSNLGTGLRASTMLHLPGLVLSEHILQVVEAASQIGLTIRGLFGEGTRSFSNLFQISNQITLGESENKLVAKLERITHSIVRHEINARLKLRECPQTEQIMLDKIGRSYGILSYSRSIGTQEALTHISQLRLGYDMGFLKSKVPPPFEKLILLSQPAVIQLSYEGAPSLSREKRDIHRANLLRETLERVELRFADIPARI